MTIKEKINVTDRLRAEVKAKNRIMTSLHMSILHQEEDDMRRDKKIRNQVEQLKTYEESLKDLGAKYKKTLRENEKLQERLKRYERTVRISNDFDEVRMQGVALYGTVMSPSIEELQTRGELRSPVITRENAIENGKAVQKAVGPVVPGQLAQYLAPTPPGGKHSKDSKISVKKEDTKKINADLTSFPFQPQNNPLGFAGYMPED